MRTVTLSERERIRIRKIAKTSGVMNSTVCYILINTESTDTSLSNPTIKTHLHDWNIKKFKQVANLMYQQRAG